MNRIICGILIVVLLMGAAPVFAQDDGELACDEGAIQDAIASALADLEAAQELTGAAALDSVAAVRTALAKLESACNGMTLSGEQSKVFGPIEIPAGYYRATASGEGLGFFLEGTILEGECGDGYGGDFSLFMYVSDDFMNPQPFEIEALLPSEGCTVLWEASEIRGPFTVTFEKIQ